MNYSAWDEARYRFIENTVGHFLFESGQLYIADQGCSQDIYLLLSGSHRGTAQNMITPILSGISQQITVQPLPGLSTERPCKPLRTT